MKLPPIDTVFFDAAGTLFRVRGSVGEIYGRYAARFGFEGGNDELIQKQIQESFVAALGETTPLVFSGEAETGIEELEKQWWQQLVRDTFVPVGLFPRIEEFFDTVYEVFRTSEAWQLEPNCEEALSDLLKKGVKLGVVSNFDSRIDDLLEELGIRQLFEAVIVSSRAPAAKPSPLIFHHALGQVGSQAERSMHIGDSIGHDYKAAKSAGLLALLYDPRDRFSAQLAENRIRSLTEVSSFLA